jgi:hypothetical protein
VKSISSSSSSPFLARTTRRANGVIAAAAMAPASSSRAARDPLLFARFDLPAVWGCRKPLDFCREARDTDNAPVASEPDATATPTEGVKDSDGTRSPTRATAMVQQAPVAGEVAQEAPRKQWNLRERTPWQDYSNRADDLRARQARKLGSADAGGNRRLSLSVKLTRQEIDADFAKITGSKAPRRPMKRSKTVQRKIEVRGLTAQAAMPVISIDLLTAVAGYSMTPSEFVSLVGFVGC